MSAPADTLTVFGSAGHATHYRSLSRNYYLSPETFEIEFERVFQRQWILIGHMAQLPEVGSFFTFTLAGENIVVTRSDAGVHGFYNVCRHRGARVCTSTAGKTNGFTCPYHAWSYAHDGRLRNAPTIPDGEYIDYADFGMKQVRVECHRGLLFAYLGRQAPSALQDAFEKMPHVPDIDPATVKVVYATDQDVRANWKLVAENNLECYHCPVNHRLLCSAMDLGTFTGELATGNRYAVEDNNLVAGSSTGLPLRPGSVSLTVSGEAACALPLLNRAGETVSNGSVHISPVFGATLFFSDYIVQHYNLPQSVDVTKVITQWLVRADAVEGVDYRLDDVIGVFDPTAQEDAQIIESNALGVSSRSYTPGPLSKAAEPLNHQMLELYLDWMDVDAP